MMFDTILIANRGEIACRIIATARRLGVKTVAVFSDADARALHVELADEAVRIGPAPATDSYLDANAIIAAAKRTGAEAIHPGYGFLSENPEFVEAVEAAGLVFVGPSADSIRAMGLKDAAKRLMEKAGVPVVPGYHGEAQEVVVLAAKANEIGYPVLIKARAGGGGKGMRKVDDQRAFKDALGAAKREAKSAFGDDRVLVEKYVATPRHIEVQVFGDSHGNVVHLFERDCSLQRRHQKVIEEAPAPGMTDDVRAAMTEAAVKAAQAINYSGAGTIEFIADGSGPLRSDGFWFMEMNTRLQVEHPVTEAITGQDLVEWQLRVAAGETLPLSQGDIAISGHAFEARLYAEDPANGFLPATGTLHHLAFDQNARNDAGVRSGDAITPFYDPMIAKVITHGETRDEALSKLGTALRGTHVAGTVTNAAFLATLASHEGFARGEVDTGLIGRDIEALAAVPQATAQEVAVAAMVALGLDGAPGRFDGFSLWAPLARRVALRYRGEEQEVRVEVRGPGEIALRVGETDTAARWQGGAWRLDGRAMPAHHAEGQRITVFGAVAQVFDVIDPLERAAEAGSGDVIEAPMPGLVKVLTAEAGQAVTAGQRLAVLEAMKMEHGLVAPRDGIVAEVLVTEGAQVEAGAPLIRLEGEE
jgi:3-methylcrotonyl-CoA carboxylase alpha subunit